MWFSPFRLLNYIGFRILNQPCIPGINRTLWLPISFFHVAGFDWLHFATEFCTGVHEGSWSVFFFSRNKSVWFGDQGSGFLSWEVPPVPQIMEVFTWAWCLFFLKCFV